jgi:hypothetical protein
VALVISNTSALTVLNPQLQPTEVVLKDAVPLTVKVVDAETKEPVEEVAVSLVGLPGSDMLRKHPWLTAALEELGSVATNAHGESFWPYRYLDEKETGYSVRLNAELWPLRADEFQKYGVQRFDHSWQDRPNPVIPETFEIYLVSRKEWTIEFVDEGDALVEGALVTVSLTEGGQDITVPIDTHRVSRFLAPGSQESLHLDRLVLACNERERLFVSVNDLLFPNTVVLFKSGVLPVEGRIEPVEEYRERSLSVCSYPIDSWTDKPNRRWVSFYLREVEWFPVADTGEFQIPSGLIGNATAVLVRDDETGIMLAMSVLQENVVNVMTLAEQSTLTVEYAGESLPEGVSLSYRIGQGDAIDVPLIMDQDSSSTQQVPIGSYEIMVTWLGRSWTFKSHVHVRAGKETRVLVPEFEPLDVSVRVSGNLSGSIPGWSVSTSDSTSLLTDVNGEAKARILLASGQANISVKHPNWSQYQSSVLSPGASHAELTFEEGEGRFLVPDWVDPSVRPEKCWIIFGDYVRSDGLWMTELGEVRLKIPVGTWKALLSIPEYGRTEMVEFQINPGEVTIVEFEQRPSEEEG